MPVLFTRYNEDPWMIYLFLLGIILIIGSMLFFQESKRLLDCLLESHCSRQRQEGCQLNIRSFIMISKNEYPNHMKKYSLVLIFSSLYQFFFLYHILISYTSQKLSYIKPIVVPINLCIIFEANGF